MKRQNIFRSVGIVGAAIMLPAWFYWGHLEKNYVTSPIRPQPEIGRTVPHFVDGVEVYITPYDNQLNAALNWIIAGSGAMMMAGLIFSGDFRFR
jgi:hypothetical protein